MVVKYTTVANVQNFLAGRVASYITNAMITVWIEEAEGIIDTWLKIAGAGTGAYSLTFSASKKPHLILEMAATAMAASIALGSSGVSWATMEQAVFMMQTCIYWWEFAEKMIKEHEFADFIIEQ